MPGEAVALLLRDEVGEHGDDGGDDDEGEQLPSSLHSQHAATSLLCGEGVLVPGGAVVIEVLRELLLAAGEREWEARRGTKKRESN